MAGQGRPPHVAKDILAALAQHEPQSAAMLTAALHTTRVAVVLPLLVREEVLTFHVEGREFWYVRATGPPLPVVAKTQRRESRKVTKINRQQVALIQAALKTGQH